jgi:chromosome segregation ATPase
VVWYEKIGKWLKNWWGVIASAVLFVAGFFVGRGRRSGTDIDIEKLREDNEQLDSEVRTLRQTADALRDIDTENKQELGELESHLTEAERAVRLLRQELDRGGGDIAELGDTNRRLRAYIEKYGSRLKEIQSDK